MINVQTSQLFQLLWIVFSILFNDIVQKVFHLVDIVYKYLKQILDSNLLRFLYLKPFKSLSYKLIMFLVLNQSLYYVSDYSLDLVNLRLLRVKRGTKQTAAFILSLFEKLRSVEL